MTHSITEKEYRRGADGGRLEGQFAPEGEAGRHPDRKISHTNLKLERADLPSDVSCGSCRKEHMESACP
jgi:hypothetical protein